MKHGPRIAVGVGVLLFVAFAGWRIVSLMKAERHAQTAPARAMEWRAHDPRALMALAELRLQQGDPEGAASAARQLLAREPLYGEAFRVLAEVADKAGRRDEALSLYTIAARRAPRDIQARAWLTQRYLEQGDHPAAIDQMDRILRMAPLRGKTVYPILVQLAADSGFAEALARKLMQSPPWRPALLSALQHPVSGSPVAAGRVMQALQAAGGMSAEEHAIWMDSLMAQGRWGEAYARWADKAVLRDGRLPLAYNGDFSHVPTNAGFDWRMRKVPGVLLRFEQATGANGTAAYLKFLNRRVPHAGLEHPLMLQPGRYTLRMRMRAQSMRSELGLQWQVACTGPGGLAGRSGPVEGSHVWQLSSMEVTIPAEGCAGQWFRLVNLVESGAAQRVSGELWIDDVAVRRE